MLGMLAMLGAVLSVPLSTAHALQLQTTAAQHVEHAASTEGDVPCHGHEVVKTEHKHCPDCPQKTCPDLGSCLAKCAQQLPLLPVGVRVQAGIVRHHILPAPAQESAGTLTPQLLRPPSV